MNKDFFNKNKGNIISFFLGFLVFWLFRYLNRKNDLLTKDFSVIYERLQYSQVRLFENFYTKEDFWQKRNEIKFVINENLLHYFNTRFNVGSVINKYGEEFISKEVAPIRLKYDNDGVQYISLFGQSFVKSGEIVVTKVVNLDKKTSDFAVYWRYGLSQYKFLYAVNFEREFITDFLLKILFENFDTEIRRFLLLNIDYKLIK